MNISVIVDMYAARPHTFAGTQLYATCKAAHRAWQTGEGRWLHAQYELSTVYADHEVGVLSPIFQWDGVNLMMTDRDPEAPRIFELATDTFILTVRVSDYYGFHREPQYLLAKRDLVNDITIMLHLMASGYSQSTANLLDWACKDCVIEIAEGDKCSKFMLIALRDGGNKSPIVFRLESENQPFSDNIINHNILEMVAFAKTSRVDFENHRLRYEVADE